ncbi:MAG: hypothetical protein E7425_03655 [Ruminococcaceae bacterium]|nr:hypothetical protein [Oscillospiraceae bacterium]
MAEKKNLVINCDVLDTRRMKEEDYAQYEQIVVNADLVLVNETSKSILARLPLTLRHDSTIEVPGDAQVELRTVNGDSELSGGTAVASRSMLIVNGVLRIRPGAEKALSQFVSILINGLVECPKSLEGYLNGMDINGSAEVYPDDCILLERSFLMDEYFPLRAQEGARYYARRVMFKNAKVDAAALAKKNVRFVCKRFIVPEELAETAAPLFDEQAECVVVPRGMTFLNEDAVLNDALVRRYGGRLFVYGNASVDPADRDGAIFARLEKLIVRGRLSVTARQEQGLAALDAEYDELDVTKGRRIRHMEKVRVDRALLDASPEGVKILNSGKVVIDEDVTAEAILEKLALEHVVQVVCTEAQESAVAAVSDHVGRIGADDGDEKAEDPAAALLRDLANTKLINADSYVL